MRLFNEGIFGGFTVKIEMWRLCYKPLNFKVNLHCQNCKIEYKIYPEKVSECCFHRKIMLTCILFVSCGYIQNSADFTSTEPRILNN